MITTLRLLNSQTTFYNLTLAAIDHGTPPATGTAVLAVAVADANDNAPSLINANGSVLENSPIGSFVTQLTATDADADGNAGPFAFGLIDSRDLFTLDERTGILRTAKVSENG